jgi:hypothetical protein
MGWLQYLRQNHAFYGIAVQTKNIYLGKDSLPHPIRAITSPLGIYPLLFFSDIV